MRWSIKLCPERVPHTSNSCKHPLMTYHDFPGPGRWALLLVYLTLCWQLLWLQGVDLHTSHSTEYVGDCHLKTETNTIISKPKLIATPSLTATSTHTATPTTYSHTHSHMHTCLHANLYRLQNQYPWTWLCLASNPGFPMAGHSCTHHSGQHVPKQTAYHGLWVSRQYER